ncbi:MAG: hypothetical protein P8P74_09075 [Crocinitomicaceae bacterium]|nr:hypothetical protein [Crocinitomicaceae bacterium]
MSFGCLSANAQMEDTTKLEKSGMFPKLMEQGLNKLSVSGYYRFLGTYTSMDEQYAEMGDITNRLFIGDDSNIPQLSINLSARPSKNTSFSTDFFLWTPLTGSDADYAKGLNLGVNLNGKHSTKYGTFSVRMGGIHWYTLSPFTFATNTGYNRISLFERNPWDPNTKNEMDRYSQYYQEGLLNQDTRWGQQAFQGFIIDGMRLPKQFSFAFMHGKSQFNGGSLPTPNTLTAGKVKKDFNKGFVSVNAITSARYSDSLAMETIGYNLVTSEFEWRFKDVKVKGEVGAGTYFSPTYNSQWGEAIDVKVELSKNLTYFPIEFRYFQISPNVINNNGIFWNTSISEYNEALAGIEVAEGGQAPIIPFASSLVSIGQMTNNRRGGIINLDMPFEKHKITLGYSAAKEITGLSDRITYGHTANNLALSRMWRWAFPADVGPYANLNKIYRGVYETLIITDSTTAAKGFNSIEISYKSNYKIFNRDLYIFYLGGFYSVQDDFSALPKYSKKAYLQSYSNQIEFYYNILDKVVLSNYFGVDRIIANDRTQLDTQSGLAKNQIGYSYAIGLDIQLSKNTGLYVRQRWMNYQDINFSLDRYSGTETSVELKIYF